MAVFLLRFGVKRFRGSEVQGSGFKGSVLPLAASVQSDQKRNSKKSECRISNHEYRIFLRQTSVEGRYFAHFIKRRSLTIPLFVILRFDIRYSIFCGSLFNPGP
jgi:hypothetical protein